MSIHGHFRFGKLCARGPCTAEGCTDHVDTVDVGVVDEAGFEVNMLDPWWRVILIAGLLIAIGVDSTRVPGPAEAWSVAYSTAAVALIVWKIRQTHMALAMFAGTVISVSVTSAIVFAWESGLDRSRGICLNLLLALFVQGYLTRRRGVARW